MPSVVYTSNISVWIFVPVFGLFSGMLLTSIYTKIWFETIFVLLMWAFVVHMLLTTFYTISGSVLKIRCGFLYNTAIRIDSIRKITETNSLVSSPACSLDRLGIVYNRYDRVLISPADKMKFIAHLTTLNPTIELKLKERIK